MTVPPAPTTRPTDAGRLLHLRRWGGRHAYTLLRPLALIGTCVTAVVLLAGSLPWLTGADPARTVLRARQVERDADPAALDAIRADLDLPASPLVGAARWLGRATTGDLGVSWVSGRAVADTLGSALAVSLNLAGIAALTSLIVAVLLVTPRVIGVGLGRPAASTRLRALSAILAAAPGFVVAVLLTSVFAVRLGWLPSSGWREPRDMILPVTALSVGATGILIRILMTAITAVAAEDWVHTWRANGARPSRIAGSVARRAIAVALPQVMLIFAGIIGAAVIVEEVYAIPGLGRVTLEAALAQDIPLVQGAVAALVVLGTVIGLLGAALHRLLMSPALTDGHGSAPVRREGRFAPTLPWWVSASTLTALIVGGLFRTVEIHPDRRHLAPSLLHPLGTDHVGRDVWGRVGQGALLTIGPALLVSLICLAVGLAVGLVSKQASAGVTDVLNAVPSVFLGLVVAAVLGPGLLSASLAICLVGWIPLAVHTRTLAAEARATGFHQAAVVAGATRRRIMVRHLLPGVIRPVAGHAVVRLARLALALTGLGFLGLGAGHDSAEWGKLLADSVVHLERAPWAMAAPAVGLVLLGLVANLAGED
ncbi:peptide/nickel transport system permease protein [Austwickia chelonae]|uniref:Putative ABC transporter permease protein n=1 Tax=Austwickia chelonae NBRC 105200 TaxID=1184607 RepID=K6VRK3_9MICO|nr:ABC transporter permease subunit [Austwickia chelonae]GAB79394.1 putative ABC transporter permease protein [Austwickia chelonae NBRC 105200]SEW43580.1 peptide/nickel transport system permease protein [Austwickia chelonae]